MHPLRYKEKETPQSYKTLPKRSPKSPEAHNDRNEKKWFTVYNSYCGR